MFNNKDMTTPFKFWKNLDIVLGNKTLKTLSEEANVVYCTMKNQRSANRYPTVDDSYRMAKALGTTVEYLLTGESEQLACPEAKAVQEDGNLQALVRAVMRDPRLIQIMGTLIESTERNIRDA